jgi:hypothetical protein
MAKTDPQAASPSLGGRLMAFIRSDAIWLILWSAPMWTGIVGRIGRPNAFMDDYGAMACAGERVLQGQVLYEANAQCPGFHSSSYVYPPYIADGFAWLIRTLGSPAIFWIYVAAFVVSIVFLLWAAVIRRLSFASFRERVPFMGFVTGNPPAHGNIAIIVYASVIATGLAIGADTLPFVALVCAAALIKPIYLTLLTMTAYAPGPRWRRAVLLVLASILPVMLSLSDDLRVQEWRAFTLNVVGHWPGGGLLEWLEDLGLTQLPVTGPIYLVYAGVLFLGGLIVAETGRLRREARLWLGAVVGVLLIPRLSAYDLLALGPGLLAAQAAVAAVSPKVARYLSINWRIACAVAFAAAIFGGLVKFGHILSLVMLIAGLIVAAIVLWRHRDDAVPRSPWPSGRDPAGSDRTGHSRRRRLPRWSSARCSRPRAAGSCRPG